MPRKKFLTPPALPEESQCRGLSIPASQEWLGLFSEALSQTIYAHNYEQVNETDLTPEQTAAIAYERYVAWLSAVCDGECPPVQLPGGQRIYRRNPITGNWEVTNPSTGEWEEPAGDDAIPAPAPRAEPTDEEKICNAAANAANVLHELLIEVLDLWNNDIAEAVAIIDFQVTVGLLIGSAFVPAIATGLALEEAFFGAFYQLMDAIGVNLWNDEFTQQLTCAFADNATLSGDTVTFDFEAVNRDILETLSKGQWVLLVAQVLYLTGVIGPQGMNVAGGTTAVTGNCELCDEWCYVFDFMVEDYDWSVTTGVYSSLDGYTHTDQFIGAGYRRGAYIGKSVGSVVTKVELSFQYIAGTVDPGYSKWAIADNTGTLASTQGALDSGLHTVSWSGERTMSSVAVNVWSSVRGSASYSGAVAIRKVRLEGKGVNPFGADNCP